MLTKLIIDKLERMNIVYEENPGNEWVKCQCINPEHNDTHPSAGINKESGIFHCFSCGHTEKFIKEDDDELDEEDLIWRSKYSNLSLVEDVEDEYLPNVTLPPKAYSIKEGWRGISATLIEELGVYYCNAGRFRGRYIFPMYYKGKAVGFDARIVDDTAQVITAKWIRPKGMNAQGIVYPYDIIKNMGNHLVITEGVMDAISYIEMGIPAIPSFGLSSPSALRIEQLIALNVEKVTIAFDNDERGVAGALRVLPYYAKWFEIVPHPLVKYITDSGEKDANDFLVNTKNNGLQKNL
jgi:DNA primase